MGDDNNSGEKPKGFHWSNQTKLMILKAESIIKKFLPCSAERVIAEIEYQTGLSHKKARGIVSIFVKREIVAFKEMKYKGKDCKCMVFVDG